MKKKIVSVIAALSIFASGTAMAYEFPNAFWQLNTAFESAYESNNDSDMIKYGTEIVDMLQKEEYNHDTASNIIFKAYNLARGAYRIGDFDTALKYFKISSEYAQKQGEAELKRISDDFILQLTPRLDLYENTNVSQKNYGVKNEPSGVLYGQISEKMTESDSLVLLYLEYGVDNGFDWARVIFDKARNGNKSIELAVNFPNQGSTARSVNAGDAYLNKLYSLISAYPNVPVYVRIGSEFNIWGNSCTPEEYKRAFKIIADSVKALPNVSTVWSISHTSSWNVNEHDFYPGDEYVDWVGAAVYGNKYFQAKPVWDRNSDFMEVSFRSGRNSDPVLMIEDLVKTYGDRKPVMISECGGSRRTDGEVQQNHEDFAAKYIRHMYTYLPMVYPQIKAMALFNKSMSNEANYYDIDNSALIKSEYESVVKSPWFIQNSNKAAANTYFKLIENKLPQGDSITLSVYPHLYGAENIKVAYYLDGTLYKTEDKEPYTVTLEGLSGHSELEVKAYGDNGTETARKYTIGNGFKDIGNLTDIQKAAINYAVLNSIMNGYEDNTIKPGNTITRAEFAAMICRMKDYNAEENCTFNDAKNHWAAKYIKACADRSLINGVGDNNFAPDSNITFEQAAKILTILYGYADQNAEYPHGFIAAGEANALFDNITDNRMGSQLKRIDAAMLMYNGRTN